jgi:hypothetical protein
MGTWAVSEINDGKEGMMMPTPIESIQIVIKIKISADFRYFSFIAANFVFLTIAQSNEHILCL